MRSTGTTISSSKPGRANRALPDSGLVGEYEAGIFHGSAERWDRPELRRVEHHVGVGGEGLIASESALRAEVHGLCADEHQGIDVRAHRIEGIEQDATSLDVLDAGKLGHQPAAFGGVREVDCQRPRLRRIHATRASPSSGMRPVPVRSSTAVWAVDTNGTFADLRVRSNTISS